ncbi:unnamed protein product [Adineta ricciae]|uniref:Uncharacterized protein n=1 Tax=Adineta ricciae TaxID=249248 RepID=A0A813XW58_ADIRI|nr:unnamed protein product [Adineta ricciae]CAF0932740.1 unnamed protein product [Adineta ricciae]
MPLISNETLSNCLLLFIGVYTFCVCILVYILIRLLKYYLKQKRFSSEIIDSSAVTTGILLKIHEQGVALVKSEFGIFEPMIIQTQNLPPTYTENWYNQQPPPEYTEQV